ncbi:MAG: helix-turn-helix domain-containing protein [Actinomycetaceae bacterium]|nr:helix-turn-helix domain-containing protein [Actinomycetaceae bacterium]
MSAATLKLALSADEAAQALGVNTKTLANWRSRGLGPRFVRTGDAGSRVLYRVRDIEQWLDAHEVETSASLGRGGQR